MSTIVFIVGAGRSGTTLLYKLLALHPEVRVITNYDVRLGRWSPAGVMLRAANRFPKIKKAVWFQAGGAAHFQHGLRRVFPIPVEGELIYSRCGVPLARPGEPNAPKEVIECLHGEFSRLRKSSGASVFVTKRTANNRRLHWLRQAFPDARFIHLVRDGRDVAFSLSQVRWWQESPVWWAGLRPGELEAEGWDPLKICARNWIEDVQAVQQGLEGLDPEQRFVLRYEQLLEGWEESLTGVCDFLGLEMSQIYHDIVRSLNLARRPPKWQGLWTGEQMETVVREQRGLLSEYGYA